MRHQLSEIHRLRVWTKAILIWWHRICHRYRELAESSEMLRVFPSGTSLCVGCVCRCEPQATQSCRHRSFTKEHETPWYIVTSRHEVWTAPSPASLARAFGSPRLVVFGLITGKHMLPTDVKS